MPILYALADALLVYLRDNPLFRITIPHKTFAYMASSKPILAAEADWAESEAERIARHKHNVQSQFTD